VAEIFFLLSWARMRHAISSSVAIGSAPSAAFRFDGVGFVGMVAAHSRVPAVSVLYDTRVLAADTGCTPTVVKLSSGGGWRTSFHGEAHGAGGLVARVHLGKLCEKLVCVVHHHDVLLLTGRRLRRYRV
jgi:hypothetical protein